MERYDSFPLSFTPEVSKHVSVYKPVRPTHVITLKIVALAVFFRDDRSSEATFPHTYATLSPSPKHPDSFKYYRGGCRFADEKIALDLEFICGHDGSITGRAQAYDAVGKPVAVRDVQVVFNIMVSKNESYVPPEVAAK